MCPGAGRRLTHTSDGIVRDPKYFERALEQKLLVYRDARDIRHNASLVFAYMDIPSILRNDLKIQCYIARHLRQPLEPMNDWSWDYLNQVFDMLNEMIREENGKSALPTWDEEDWT